MTREPQTPQEQYEDDQRRYAYDQGVRDFDNRMTCYQAIKKRRTAEAKKNLSDMLRRRKAFRRRKDF